MLTVPPIHAALMKRLGRDVPLSTTYGLLARHGWRKVQPDTKRPNRDPAWQDEFKKSPAAVAAASLKNEDSPPLVEGASPHKSKELEIPKNVSFIRLPPYSPFWSIVKIRLTEKRNFVSKTSWNCFLRH